jgi:acyl carrier protein
MMFKRIKDLIERTLGREGLSITMDTDLVGETGINSLELVELVCAFESEFGINIPDRDIKKFRYMREVARYLEEKLGYA